jgi:hypothetical protein
LSVSSEERAIFEAGVDELFISTPTVGFFFQNSETYICSDIQYSIANREEGSQKTDRESLVTIVDDKIQFQFDNKPIHLNLAA